MYNIKSSYAIATGTYCKIREATGSKSPTGIELVIQEITALCSKCRIK